MSQSPWMIHGHEPIALDESKQGREITTADFDLLLTLDASPTPPLHEHLLRALPAIMTQEHGNINRNSIAPAPASTLNDYAVVGARDIGKPVEFRITLSH